MSSSAASLPEAQRPLLSVSITASKPRKRDRFRIDRGHVLGSMPNMMQPKEPGGKHHLVYINTLSVCTNINSGLSVCTNTHSILPLWLVGSHRPNGSPRSGLSQHLKLYQAGYPQLWLVTPGFKQNSQQKNRAAKNVCVGIRMVECTRTLPLHVGIVPAKRPRDKWETPRLFQILFKLVNVNSAFYFEHKFFLPHLSEKDF